MKTDSTVINIFADLPLWLVVIALLAALLFALWSYRKTVPPVNMFLRSVLFFLRWGALCGGIIILARPVIEIEKEILEPASISVLLDRSASMASNYNGVSKISQVKDILESEPFQSFTQRYKVEFFGFADSLSSRFNSVELLQSLSPDQIGTNITRAWMEVKERQLLTPPSVIFLISDGVNNKGSDPVRMAKTVGIPVWTIGVGSADPPKDLMITSIIHNPVVYQDSKTPVTVKYRCIDAVKEKGTVVLRDSEGKVIERRSFDVLNDFFEGSITFDYTVTGSGRLGFSAGILPVENEITTDNNQRSFYINVLSNRMRILVMAGPPDNGSGDLIRRLNLDEHIEVESRITRRSGFYEGGWPNRTTLAKTDVVILHHFPVRTTRTDELRKFASQLEEYNLPVLFFDGGNVDWRKLKLLADLLPVKPESSSRRIHEGKAHPVQRHAITTDPDQSDLYAGWSELPPLNFSPGAYTALPHVKTLIEFYTSSEGKRFPALLVSETGGTRTAAFLGRNLWLWGLASPGEEGMLEPLLNRLIRWLAVRKIDERVILSFDGDVFSNQERVGLQVFVQNESFVPVDGAEVIARITRKDTVTAEIILSGKGTGRYQGSFLPWDEGIYEIDVTASLEGETIGSDQGSIRAEPFNIELLDVRLNEGLLKSVGQFSGGGYVPVQEVDSLFEFIDLPSHNQVISKRLELWGRGWILAVIIGLLVVEWFIRARVGML